MRTTDPTQAIRSLLSSPESDPVISVNEDGLFHIHDASQAPDKGAFVILTTPQAHAEATLYRLSVRCIWDEPSQPHLEKWIKREWKTWFRSARLNASFSDAS
jgi:hypothetical protein